MRRRGLLIVLWLVGTTLATGVVFQAVKVMTDGLTSRSNEAGRSGPLPAKRTTTTTSSKSASSAVTGASTTTLASVTTEQPTTEAATAEPPVASSEEPAVDDAPQGPGTVTRTPTRTTASPSGTGGGTNGSIGTTPQSTSPPPVRTPATNPPTAATTASRPTTTEPPPTTQPVSADQCSSGIPLAGGTNRVAFKRCQRSDPPNDYYARDPKPFQGFGYTPSVVSYGPGVVQVVFRGSSTWTCTAGPDGAGAWFQGCEQS